MNYIYSRLSKILQNKIDTIIIEIYKRFTINIIRKRAINYNCLHCQGSNINIIKPIIWHILPRKYKNGGGLDTIFYINLCFNCEYRYKNITEAFGWDELDAIESIILPIHN